MATTSSNSHDHPVKVGGKSYRTGSIGHQHTVPDQFTPAEVTALKAILAAGGSGGGTTPVPNDPPPAEPPTTEPSGSGVTLPVGTSQSAFLTAVANLSYDYILLAGGDYPWNMCDISVDRTANPLLIQPVAGQRVRFPGFTTSYGVFRFGVTAYAKHITFDGRVADGFLFDGTILAQAGTLAIFGADYLTWRNYTIRNAKVGGNGDAIRSYAGAYISAPYGGRVSDHLVFDRGTLLAPNANRGVSAYQIASNSGTHGDISITNQVINGHALALWVDRPVTGLTLDEWDVNDCGQVSSGKSIRIVTADVDGTYSNLDLTTSLGFANASAGFTDGGGNSIP